jgi:hypothetical protein
MMTVILFGVASLHEDLTNWSLELSFEVDFLLDQLLIFLEGFCSPSTSMTFHYPSILCLSSFMFFVFFC